MMMAQQLGLDFTLQAASVLHDVVEDGKLSLRDVIEHFGERIGELVDFLSRRDGETYFRYIKRVCEDPDAVKVKMIDLADNRRPERLIEDSLKRRYMKAFEVLEESSQDEEFVVQLYREAHWL
jgi:guanosine-3',5'-bis(diphosphate) 3'-pyrophosphohydrolase